jgi:NADPH-dependent 2,4-dienoyl-CoA reductase/sulfur reductase-like enzyme
MMFQVRFHGRGGQGVVTAAGLLASAAFRKGRQVPVDAAPTGKRVLVVGAGPSGLSAAYHLTRLDHAVTVKNAGAEPGGMMRYGIPSTGSFNPADGTFGPAAIPVSGQG